MLIIWPVRPRTRDLIGNHSENWCLLGRTGWHEPVQKKPSGLSAHVLLCCKKRKKQCRFCCKKWVTAVTKTKWEKKYGVLGECCCLNVRWHKDSVSQSEYVLKANQNWGRDTYVWYAEIFQPELLVMWVGRFGLNSVPFSPQLKKHSRFFCIVSF